MASNNNMLPIFDILENFKDLYRKKHGLSDDRFITLDILAKEFDSSATGLYTVASTGNIPHTIFLRYMYENKIPVDILYVANKKKCTSCDKDITVRNQSTYLNENIRYINPECKRCFQMSGYEEQRKKVSDMRQKRSEEKDYVKSRCVTCEDELSDTNKCTSEYKKRDGTISITTKSECLKCINEKRIKIRNQVKLCDKCLKPKKYHSFRTLEDTICAICVKKIAEGKPTIKTSKVKKIPKKKVASVAKKVFVTKTPKKKNTINCTPVAVKKATSKKREPKIKEVVIAEKELNTPTSLISIRSHTEKDLQMIEDFKKKNKIKKDVQPMSNFIEEYKGELLSTSAMR